MGQNEVLNLPLVNRDLYTLLSITGGVTQQRRLELAGRPRAADDDQRIAAARRSAASTSSSTAATTPPACAAPATRRRIPKPSRSSASSPTTTPPNTAATGRRRRRRDEVGHQQFHGAAFEFFRDEKLNAKRWAPPGVTADEGSARPQPVRRARSAGRSRRTRRSSSPATRGLRQEETYYRNTAVVPTARERAGDFSQSAIQAARSADQASRSRATSFPRAGFDAAALAIQERYVPASNLPNNFYEVSRPDPLDTDEATLEARPLPLADAQHGASATSTRRAPTRSRCRGTGNIPWVDRDFKWTQHNLNVADTWTLSSDDRSTSSA